MIEMILRSQELPPKTILNFKMTTCGFLITDQNGQIPPNMRISGIRMIPRGQKLSLFEIQDDDYCSLENIPKLSNTTQYGFFLKRDNKQKPTIDPREDRVNLRPRVQLSGDEIEVVGKCVHPG